MQYCRKYIWRFAEIAAPLTNLLKDGGWLPPSDPEVLTVVDKLKESLISSPVLAYFDVNVVTTDLYCDASGGSIGAVLQQTDKDGEVRPVGFYSRKLTPAEESYSTYDPGGDTTLYVDDFGSTTQHLTHDDSSPVDYSEEVMENLTLPSPSKIGVDGYAASSFVTADFGSKYLL